MGRHIFEAFERREKQVAEFLAGCAKKHGLPCNCGASCRCKGCGCRAKAPHSQIELSKQGVQEPSLSNTQDDTGSSLDDLENRREDISCNIIEQKQKAFQDALPGQKLHLSLIPPPNTPQLSRPACCKSLKYPPPAPSENAVSIEVQDIVIDCENQRNKATRNLSLISSISGLSAIEWDNIAGFDVNEDHSAHIDPLIVSSRYQSSSPSSTKG